jgi:hypothetical protein
MVPVTVMNVGDSPRSVSHGTCLGKVVPIIEDEVGQTRMLLLQAQQVGSIQVKENSELRPTCPKQGTCNIGCQTEQPDVVEEVQEEKDVALSSGQEMSNCKKGGDAHEGTKESVGGNSENQPRRTPGREREKPPRYRPLRYC